jgi:hypothetical protein
MAFHVKTLPVNRMGSRIRIANVTVSMQKAEKHIFVAKSESMRQDVSTLLMAVW